MSDELDRVDYYALLGVARSASADAIRAAFHDLARRYHPDRWASGSELERARAGRIYRRGAEAYRVLMGPARRRYDEGLKAGQLRLAPEAAVTRPSSSGRLTVDAPRARPFATKALQAWKAGDYKTAKLNLKLALSHEPDNALLKARLADVEQKLAGR